MILLKALILSPGTILGFPVALIFVLATRWKPSVGLWVLAALLNFPTVETLSSRLPRWELGGWV
jgi:hypothetical protein